MWPVMAAFFVVFCILLMLGTILAAMDALGRWHSLTWRARTRSGLKIGGLTLFVASWVSVVCQLIANAALGGSAEGGKIDGGEYFLYSHGRFTKVPLESWQFMVDLESITRVLFPLGLAGIATCFVIRWIEGARRPTCTMVDLVATDPDRDKTN